MSSPEQEFDELVGTEVPEEKVVETPDSRIVNLILDSSAFTRGIGNIKRWYQKEYVESRNQNLQNVIVNLYIPTYTLYQFEFLKKGPSIVGTYARHSIKFIDELFENDLTTSKVLPNFTITMNIETPKEKGPEWNDCRQYQVHSPRVREFPNFKTKFDSNYIGQKLSKDTRIQESIPAPLRTNDIQYENSQSYMEAAANSGKFAVMPARLKYLISSCIQKKFVGKQDWKLVSEDPITRIWTQSYDIESMNVNEAELLIFQRYDVNKLYNPHQFSLEDEVYHNSILQETIDTTIYSYKELDAPRKYPRNPEPRTVTGVTDQTRSDLNGEIINKERFDAINYAPRGVGELWKPPPKESKRRT